MAKFLLAYKGGDQPQGEEEGRAVMQAWTTWFSSLGEAVADMGNPIGATKSVGPDGTSKDGGSDISGYSVLEADSMDSAVAMAQSCPHLQANGIIDVCETFDVM